jgi:hypothetical protein
MARRATAGLRLYTRNSRDFSKRFPQVVAAVRHCQLERHMDTTAQSAQSQGQDTTDEQNHMNELQLKLGPEFGAMMDEYKDIKSEFGAGSEMGDRRDSAGYPKHAKQAMWPGHQSTSARLISV